MGFSVLHIEKGTSGKASGLGNHIERKKNVPNADPSKLDFNVYLDTNNEGKIVYAKSPFRKGTLQERINNRIKEGYKGKTAIRKDAVTHLNVILSGSHEDMLKLQRERKLGEWLRINYEFAKFMWGEKNIVEFALHLDERTPHVHCVVVPLTKDGRLTAKEVMGNRLQMSKLQDIYGEVMNKYFGLERGIKGSTATHDSVREFYGRIDKALSTNLQISTPKVNVPSIEEPPIAPWKHKNWKKRQNKAIGAAIFNSVDIYTRDMKIEAERQIKTASVQILEGSRYIRVLKSEVSSLKKQIDQLRNPEKYEEERKRKEAYIKARKEQEQAKRIQDNKLQQNHGGFRR